MFKLFDKEELIKAETFINFEINPRIKEEIYKIVWFDGVGLRNAVVGNDLVISIELPKVPYILGGALGYREISNILPIQPNTYVIMFENKRRMYITDAKEVFTKEIE